MKWKHIQYIVRDLKKKKKSAIDYRLYTIDFPGEEKTLHNSWTDQEHSPGGRHVCVKVNNQEKPSPE